MSPRAACRLETLGFADVYDYFAGKADWLAHGLRGEGENADRPRALDVAAHDVVTCSLHEAVGDVRTRAAASRYGFAFVVSGDGILLGRLGRAALHADGSTSAEELMEPGPSTIRADATLEPLSERLRAHDLTGLLITTPGGRLLGLLRRDDLEAALRSTR
jgi:CBS domain-containing protein